MLNTKTSKLNLIIEGNNDSEVIIFLHGGPGVPDYLDKVSDILSQNFRTVRFDQRGVGNSECLNQQYSIDQYLSDIDKIIEYLKVDKVHIFGHSWGGLLAQIWAAKNQQKIKSLFLCSPSSGTGDVWKIMEKEVMSYNKNKSSLKEWMTIGINSLLGIMGSNNGYKNIFKLLWRFYFQIPSKAPNADEHWLSGINAKAVNKTRKSIVAFDNNQLDKSLHNFNKPVVVTFGSYDIYGVSKELTRERLPNSTYKIFENAGHLPWLQDKTTFTKIIHKFYGMTSIKG